MSSESFKEVYVVHRESQVTQNRGCRIPDILPLFSATLSIGIYLHLSDPPSNRLKFEIQKYRTRGWKDDISCGEALFRVRSPPRSLFCDVFGRPSTIDWKPCTGRLPVATWKSRWQS